MKIHHLTALIVTMALSACGGGGGGSTGGGSELFVVSVSGTQVSLNGTYTTGCRSKSGIDVLESMVINGGGWAYNRTAFSSTDGSCSTGQVDAANGAGTVSAGSVGAITGWTEDSGVTAATAPMAADASGALSNTESFTSLKLTVITASGAFPWAVNDVVDYFYIVDDTGAANVMYVPDTSTTASPSGAFSKI